MLRNKVKITDVSNSYGVWSVFGNAVTHSPLPQVNAGNPQLSVKPEVGVPPQSIVTGGLVEWWKDKKDGVLLMDPRFERLGARMILPLSETRE